MKHSRIAGVFILSLLPLVVFAAATGIFSDIKEDHPFKGEIESLARSGILKGNPDGNFYPDRTVNRAEFLKMLYLAAGRVAKPIYSGCFPDVEPGSWYELYVCDAASRESGIVQGYPDGKFRPASPVNRTEALKMMYLALELNAPNISQSEKELIKFVDISVSAWYSKYISAAYISGVLPITGQAGARFYPEKEMTRGEAAAYIWNGLKALERQKAEVEKAAKVAVSSSSSSAPADIIKEVSFPFSDSDKFQMKKPVAYVFNLTQNTVVWAKVSLNAISSAEVTCRLYLLNADGFSDEYYLGFEYGNTCSIRAAVRPGKYQFQIQPTAENLNYAVETKADVSDGNDGFREAVKIQMGKATSGVLNPNDIYDWYYFNVDKEVTATVDLTSTEPLDCVIYTPSTVDQYGFVGPQCNTPYKYAPPDDGAPYMIGIARKGQPAHKVTYTLKVN